MLHNCQCYSTRVPMCLRVFCFTAKKFMLGGEEIPYKAIRCPALYGSVRAGFLCSRSVCWPAALCRGSNDEDDDVTRRTCDTLFSRFHPNVVYRFVGSESKSHTLEDRIFRRYRQVKGQTARAVKGNRRRRRRRRPRPGIPDLGYCEARVSNSF